MEKNAPDKILAEEDYALFKLVKDIAENEQIVRVIITNKKINIIDHNDIDQVNKPYLPPRNLEKTGQLQNGLILSTFLENNREFLFLEIPLNYQNVGIGRAQIVISQKNH
ncbi:MAG: hypothetical protein GY860_13505 [Desulfobacteraceae bacterium]|nr:hypothetical protein [Desulfobacteraceae bacterium]